MSEFIVLVDECVREGKCLLLADLSSSTIFPLNAPMLGVALLVLASISTCSALDRELLYLGHSCSNA